MLEENEEEAGSSNAETCKDGGVKNLPDKESKAISSALASETRNIINSDLFNNLGDLEFESKMDDKEEPG